MESLRLILVLCGIAIIIGLIIYDRRIERQGKAQEERPVAATGHAKLSGPLQEEELPSDFPSFDEITHSADDDFMQEAFVPNAADKQPSQLDTERSLRAEPRPSSSPQHANSKASAPQQTPTEPQVLLLSLIVPVDQMIIGGELRATLEGLGFHLGAMQIFHRMDRGQPLISIANLLEPGTFDLEILDDQHIPGLWLFAQLPATQSGGELVDELLEVGERLAILLCGTLCDGKRLPLDDAYREQLYHQAALFDGTSN